MGAKYSNVWPGIPLKIWSRFCRLEESERYICGSQLGRQSTAVRCSREPRKIRSDGLEPLRGGQPVSKQCSQSLELSVLEQKQMAGYVSTPGHIGIYSL